MRLHKSIFLAIAGAFALAASASAAVECRIDESPTVCITRTNGDARKARQAARPMAQAAAAADQANDLARKPTGVETGGANLATNTTNFIPFLSLAGLLGDVRQGDTEGTYVADLNFLVPGLIHGLSPDNNAKLQGIFNSQPKVSDAIKAQLPADRRDELTQKLQSGLGDLSDYALSFSYSWIDHRHGRGFKQYEDRFAALVAAVNLDFDQVEGDGLKRAGQAVVEIKDRFGIGGDLLNTNFNAIPNKEAAALLKAAVEKGQEESLAQEAADHKVWMDAGLGYFADLIDNQPQLNVSARQSFRDDVVGGDETTATVSYEWGYANLNRALQTRECREDLDKPETNEIASETLRDCLKNYKKFIKDHKAHLKDGEKFSLSAEYRDLNARKFDVPAQGLTGLTLNGAKKVIVKAGYGRYFPDPSGGAEPVRLDFVGSYEDVSDDPLRQDRGVATLTVTRKFGTISVPFGIVYANHGEFLGEVDERLSAHVGLKFDLGGFAPQPPAP